MKKGFIILALLIAIAFVSCTTPGSTIVYPEPIFASESRVFVARGATYAQSRSIAIQKGVAAGYVRIAAEVIDIRNTFGQTQVSLIMFK